jgi:hypothetical protein
VTGQRVAPGPEFAELFRTFRHSAWRLETQGVYHEPYEQAELARFLVGQPLDVSYLADWLDDVRTATHSGRRFERVRVLTEPLTDYLRFELTVAPHNAEAGEDIRVLSPAEAQRLRLPDHDFWLFDDERVAVMEFGPAGLIGADIHTDPGTVTQHRQWRDLAWRHATPFETYRTTAHI